MVWPISFQLVSIGHVSRKQQWPICKICFCLPCQSCCCYYNEDTPEHKNLICALYLWWYFSMKLAVTYNQRNSKSSNKIIKQINLCVSLNFIGLYNLTFTVVLLPFLQNKHAQPWCCFWNCTSLVGYLCNF